jgi:hypothetical protein
VRAVNRAGEGQPGEPCRAVTCRSRFVKPFIVGDAMRDLVVKRGQALRKEWPEKPKLQEKAVSCFI